MIIHDMVEGRLTWAELPPGDAASALGLEGEQTAVTRKVQLLSKPNFYNLQTQIAE